MLFYKGLGLNVGSDIVAYASVNEFPRISHQLEETGFYYVSTILFNREQQAHAYWNLLKLQK